MGTWPPERLAALLPDEPRRIDLRGMLLGGRCRVFHEPDPATGGVARSLEWPVAATWGNPAQSTLEAALADRPAEFHVLWTDPPGMSATALDEWTRRAIWVHRPIRPARRATAPGDATFRVVPGGGRWPGIPDVPPELADDLALARDSGRPAAFAEAGGWIVSLCFAAWRTESMWDVSVGTWTPWRRRGLAAACFQTLRGTLAAEGLAPVWCAHEDNPASLGLAALLGFARHARIESWSSPTGARTSEGG